MLGEVAGVATNSRGEIIVYTRTGIRPSRSARHDPFAHDGSRMFQFDRAGEYVRKLARTPTVRHRSPSAWSTERDNLWAVDQMSNMVTKFAPQARRDAAGTQG